MNSNQLSVRLAKVASFVPQGSIVADIGSDHAYLPCYLIKKQIISHAIAGEVVKGPYESAKKQVQQEQLESSIDVRLANGLQAIEEGDQVSVVTIAGMGGPLITSIIDSGHEKLKTVERIITQPNIHARAIREWAMQNQWKIVEEDIFEEDQKIYEIVVLEKGEASYTEKELHFGPYLLKNRNASFQKKWGKELESLHYVLSQIQSAKEPNQQKINEIESKINQLQEVLT